MSENTVETPAPAIVAVSARDIDTVANQVMVVMPQYKIRKTSSNTYRNLTLAEDENVNWKKGLVYFIARYAKGVNLEFWLYSAKGGAHLAEHKDAFKILTEQNAELYTIEPLGHAIKIRTKIPDAMTDEEMANQIKAFSEGIEPIAQEVRAKIVIVSKKDTKKEVKPQESAETQATEASAEAPATETKSETPAQPKAKKSKSKVKVAA